jgi:hypothetical protein
MNEAGKSKRKVALHSALSHLNAAQREIEPFDDLKKLAEKVQSLRFEIDQEIIRQEDDF